jgi:YspA, cpYpsA-related SLOG family
MKLAVVGSRNFTNYNILFHVLTEVVTWQISQIISGGAKGTDTLAKQFAEEFNIPLVEYLPEWNVYGKAAGMLRNKHIVDNCDKLIAFWDGHSPGTRSSIELANRSNKLLKITIV